MNLTITVSTNGATLRALAAAPKQAEQGLRRAANRAASRLRTQAVKGITQTVAIKSAYVRERITLRTASPGNPSAGLRARKRETRLDRLPYRQLTRRGANGRRVNAGISVRVKRGRSPQILPGAFLVPLKTGKTDGAGGFGIAIRKGSGRAYEVLHTSSVRDLFADQVQGPVGAEAQTYFVRQTEQELARALKRGRS